MHGVFARLGPAMEGAGRCLRARTESDFGEVRFRAEALGMRVTPTNKCAPVAGNFLQRRGAFRERALGQTRKHSRVHCSICGDWALIEVTVGEFDG
jgi:hypothetical protein